MQKFLADFTFAQSGREHALRVAAPCTQHVERINFRAQKSQKHKEYERKTQAQERPGTICEKNNKRTLASRRKKCEFAVTGIHSAVQQLLFVRHQIVIHVVVFEKISLKGLGFCQVGRSLLKKRRPSQVVECEQTL